MIRPPVGTGIERVKPMTFDMGNEHDLQVPSLKSSRQWTFQRVAER